MILDTIENAELYAAINPRIAAALDKAKEYTVGNYPGGRVDLDGDKLFLLLNSYETQDEAEAIMEAHRKYIDVMYMVEGAETIFVKPVSQVNNITQQYDPSIDALLADRDADCTPVRLQSGSFIVLFPQDAHAPACRAAEKAEVKKIIAKVRID